VCAVLTLAALAAACGRKGPPLAPLHLVPAAPTGGHVRQLGAEVQLGFVLPSNNLNGTGHVDLDHVEIYAVTVAPGAAAPPNRDLLTRKYVVGTVAVKVVPEGDEPAPADPAADKRPSPGEAVTFVERLTEDKLKPAVLPMAPPTPAPVPPPAATPPAAGTPPVVGTPPLAATGAAVAPPPVVAAPTYAVRIYAMRGIAKGGRAGAAAPRLQVPIVPVPPPPSGVAATNTEQAIVIAWTPAAAAPDAPAPAYNVYAPDTTTPLNPQPLAAAPFEQAGVEFGRERCFVVRTVAQVGGVAMESEPSARGCFTPRDTFAPAVPTGVAAVSDTGVVSLIWDANAEADLAGYLVLRAEAPGGTLQPLTPAPIRETSYADRSVKPGAGYIYVVVAIDRATPPNRSGPSERVTVLAR
jgi:hypothetical protein